MKVEVRVQYSRFTTWAYERGDHTLGEMDWRTDSRRHWFYDEVMNSEAIARVVNEYVDAIQSREVSYHSAFVRLKVKFSRDVMGGTLSHEIVIDGPRNQEKKEAVDPNMVRLKFSLEQVHFVTGDNVAAVPDVGDPSLPKLDDTPVPAGTVVEVLDEWGLPTGSTEVT